MHTKASQGSAIKGLAIEGQNLANVCRVLSEPALQFIEALHRKFNPERQRLLDKRNERQQQFNLGQSPNFLTETSHIRNDLQWRVAKPPLDLQTRHVEITGPAERKMIINALNSGADMFMADFEDSLSPTWANVVDGQQCLMEAVEGTLAFSSTEGKSYRLNPQTAVLKVRPRGWHLLERHVCIDKEPISAALCDFGLFFFHNAKKLIEKGSGPYFYLPKLESHHEARLWNEVFIFAQEYLHMPVGTIRATVLIETISAAFEMEEILYELRHHILGLNAGRWDYIFSIIKKFHSRKDFIFPDRSQITMTVPFMKAYTRLLVSTCRQRGAQAIGGMAACIPNREDPLANAEAFKKVKEDKEREAIEGFDGTWVAHPDLVPLAREVFEGARENRVAQPGSLHELATKMSADLLDFTIHHGEITEVGIRQNIRVSLQYLDCWFRGIGAAAINHLMEDCATAEISRSQLWHWIYSPHGVLASGQKIEVQWIQDLIKEEYGKLESQSGPAHKFHEAKNLLEKLISVDHFEDFLTIPAYDKLV